MWMEQTGDKLEAARCGESESRLGVCGCVDRGSEYGRRSCGKLAHEWLARSLARQVCAKSRGRSGQRASSSSSNDQNPLQLPTGHAVLETSVSSTRQSCIAAPSATASLIAVALYRWKHVTSML